MSSNNPFFHLKNKFRKTKKSKNNDKDDENINKNIGPYIITNKIREGIYSKIYLGRSKYTNDDVAIKIISKETLLENMEDLSLLLNHIESLKILKHKNIISLYEIYESPKFFYLIMEYFPKKNLLEKIILKKRLSENEALIIFVQILDALVYMHKMNIAHRNIRTDHILFDKNNRPKLTGFNYSTFYEKNKKINGSFGSLCYTCPEILNEEEYKTAFLTKSFSSLAIKFFSFNALFTLAEPFEDIVSQGIVKTGTPIKACSIVIVSPLNGEGSSATSHFK